MTERTCVVPRCEKESVTWCLCGVFCGDHMEVGTDIIPFNPNCDCAL